MKAVKKNRRNFSKTFQKNKVREKYKPKDSVGKIATVVLTSIDILPESVDSLLVDALFSNDVRICKFFSVCDFEYLTYWKQLKVGDTVYMYFRSNGRTFLQIRYYTDELKDQE